MKELRLIVFLAILQSSLGQEAFSKFVTSKHYKGFKLVFESSHALLASRSFPGARSPTSSRLSCFKECVATTNCQSVNFYSSRSHHTCELLADNFCLLHGRMSLVFWPGAASVWDKVGRRHTRQACIDKHFQFLSQSQWCETARPGCAGTWPDCNDCVQTCLDCEMRTKNPGNYSCTLWPGGTSTRPIFTTCVGNMTILMGRLFHPTIQSTPIDYRMSFPDMNRVIELNAYNSLLFMFFTESHSEPYAAIYKNPYIDAQGNLYRTTGPTDLDTYIDESGSAAITRSIPFVEVDEDTDTSSCGSFWRIHPKAPPQCPGGPLSLFGSVKRDAAGRVIDTGIHFAIAPNKVFTYGAVALFKHD